MAVQPVVHLGCRPRIRAAPSRRSPTRQPGNRHVHQGRLVRRHRFGHGRASREHGLGQDRRRRQADVLHRQPGRRQRQVPARRPNSRVSQFLDQFQNPLSETTTLTWSASELPAGAAAPQFTTSGSTTTVKFSAAGTYVLTVTQTDSSHDIRLAIDHRAVVARCPRAHSGQPHHRHRHQPAIADAVVRRPVRQADHRDLPG